MKEAPRRHAKLVAALVGLDAVVLAVAVLVGVKLHFAIPAQALLLLLAVLVVALEMLVVDLPFRGFATVSLAATMALSITQGPQWAACILLVALVIREVTRGRGSAGERLESVSVAFIPTAASCLAFYFVGHIPDTRQLLQPDQWMGVAAATAVYALADFAMTRLCALDLPPERRKLWLTVATRARLFGTSLVPIGWGAVLLLRLGSPTAEGYNFWLFLVLVLPLVAFHRALRYVVQDDVHKELGTADDAVGRMREELLDFKNQNRSLMADLHKRVDEIAILRDMGQQLGASQDLNKTLEIVISMIRKLLIYQSCVIYLGDSKGGLVPARCVSPYADVIELSPLLQLEESMVNLVMQSKKPVLVSDMQGDSEHRIFNDEKSIMCVPLIVKDSIMGVIYVGTLRPGTYNDDHVHMLETLANPAAIAIRSARFHETQEERLYQEMRLKERQEEQTKQFKVLFRLGSDLNRALKLEEILDIVLENINKLVPCQSCIIFQCREGEVLAKKASSPYGALFTNYTVSLDDENNNLDGENILAWVALNKRHLVLSDARESRFASLIQKERSVILMPLLAEDEVIGEIYVGSAEPDVYDDATLNLCTMVSAQAALAIQKALLFEKTEGLAITDGVTGLYTHRYFQERLSEEVRWAERYGRPLALVMVDTDHFKKFNDTLGHPEGDKLLKEISALLRSYTRESDLVCRYGGDEFSLILKDTDKESALKTAERIRDAFQLRFGKLPVKVTASIGVATFPGDARTKVELVSAADTALYRSKQGGRNRVSGATPLESKQPASH